MARQQDIAQAALRRHGRTFAAELGVRLQRNTPSPLFRLLCLSLLTSAPVQANLAMRGAQALGEAGWTTPDKLRRSSWAERAAVLNRAGYARVDEKTATQLERLNDRLLSEYGGDLRRLRGEADRRARRVPLKQFHGIGDRRRIPARFTAWPEFHLFADKAALKAAEKLVLPTEVEHLPAWSSRAVPPPGRRAGAHPPAKDFGAVRRRRAGGGRNGRSAGAVSRAGVRVRWRSRIAARGGHGCRGYRSRR